MAFPDADQDSHPPRTADGPGRFTARRPGRKTLAWTACRVLGAERLENLTIHHGRHTFISHALAGGRTLAEVRDAVGHSNVSITSGYLHVEQALLLLSQPKTRERDRRQ